MVIRNISNIDVAFTVCGDMPLEQGPGRATLGIVAKTNPVEHQGLGQAGSEVLVYVVGRTTI